MAYRKITADKILTMSGPAEEDLVVICSEDGEIRSLEAMKDHDPASVQKVSGWLIPGFVNAHCHIELSHMKGMVDTGLGLTSFIEDVVKKRGASAEVIKQKISDAEEEMIKDGIVAVGDISNTSDSFTQKALNNIRYHTFVEYFDLLQQDWTQREYEKYEDIYHRVPLPGGHQRSRVPHATYSVSGKLFELLRMNEQKQDSPISIHMDEFTGEDQFIRHKKGPLLDFYRAFDLKTNHVPARDISSVAYAGEQMDRSKPTIFVHNTTMGPGDIKQCMDDFDAPYFCFCPNANLYIENRLAKYQYFLEVGAICCLGTDSLTSNWHLSILEEMRTIRHLSSYVPTETLLEWATLNGAKALGFDDTLGSMEPGKRPGLLSFNGHDDPANWSVERIL